MKRLVSLLLIFCCQFTLTAAEHKLAGDWVGKITTPMGELRLVFHLQHDGQEWKAWFDSPDQGVNGILANIITLNEENIKTETPQIGATFQATLINAKLSATWSQAGIANTMEMLQMEAPLAGPNRPQTPKAPYKYAIEEVSFINENAAIKLVGTLTKPQTGDIKGKILLVSGSGPQDRDSDILGHKFFHVIADYLTNQGFAVLRYDERGVGQSGGDFSQAHFQDLQLDTEAAITFLNNHAELKDLPLGLIGHSEGGFMVGKLASELPLIDFIVMMAAPGIDGDKLFLEQTAAILSAEGYSKSYIDERMGIQRRAVKLLLTSPPNIDLINQIKGLAKEMLSLEVGHNEITDEAIKNVVAMLASNTIRDIIKFEPEHAYKNINVPTLALYAELDLQVLADSNMTGIEKIFSKKPKLLTAKKYKQFNHLFQPTETGRPSEYAMISQTISPIVLQDISNWLDKILIAGSVQK
ncbi:alpha/beta hydrolase [Agaribacter marinus]|uniref:Lipoprotein n=1 Tax=Agaribacter marinus TaxID=1431249 RepID=A0AA37SYZ8_9ALTE|nr:alpha/beta fold hydrolase [Agaribacter marinus]GLR70421.1 lipoprotein [Agaribacter marinus]